MSFAPNYPLQWILAIMLLQSMNCNDDQIVVVHSTSYEYVIALQQSSVNMALPLSRPNEFFNSKGKIMCPAW